MTRPISLPLRQLYGAQIARKMRESQCPLLRGNLPETEPFMCSSVSTIPGSYPHANTVVSQKRPSASMRLTWVLIYFTQPLSPAKLEQWKVNQQHYRKPSGTILISTWRPKRFRNSVGRMASRALTAYRKRTTTPQVAGSGSNSAIHKSEEAEALQMMRARVLYFKRGSNTKKSGSLNRI